MESPLPAQWRSRRLASRDYGAQGEYFVTICSRNRVDIFGAVENGCMRLSDAGRIVEQAWRELPNHFPHIALDAFVVMPNHLHGILIFASDGQSLGTVVGGFKSQISRAIERRVWQRYYYDHVIRTQKELAQIRLYIANNPRNWGTDEENVTAHDETTREAGKPASYSHVAP